MLSISLNHSPVSIMRSFPITYMASTIPPDLKYAPTRASNESAMFFSFIHLTIFGLYSVKSLRE